MKREEILAVYEQGPEAVVQLVTSLFQIIEELKETVKKQEKRISDLENRLAKDSRNSSLHSSKYTPIRITDKNVLSQAVEFYTSHLQTDGVFRHVRSEEGM
jgi:hypothetical protein